MASYPLSCQAPTHVEVELGCENNFLHQPLNFNPERRGTHNVSETNGRTNQIQVHNDLKRKGRMKRRMDRLNLGAIYEVVLFFSL